MGLDNRYFNYCGEIGLLKEHYSKQQALDSIKAKVKQLYSADPEFIRKVQGLTLDSYEVSTRSCVIYHYSADIEYVVGGNIRDTKVSDFGYRHISKSLHITEFDEDSTYSILRSGSEIPYDVYHEENLFTLEDMKEALTDKLGEYLPSNYQSYRTKSWKVSAYIVPVLVVIIDFGGDSYYQYYNLHNGHYSWNWPIDPVIIKKGKQTKNLAKFARIASIVLSIFAALMGLSNFGSGSNEIYAALVPIGAAVLNWILNKKANEKPKNYQEVYENNRNKNMFSLLVREIFMVVLSVVALICASTL